MQHPWYHAFGAFAPAPIAGPSHKAARAAGGTRSAVLLPELNVSKYIRDVLTFKIDGKTEPDEVPVYFDKESKEKAYIHNLRGLKVLCGVNAGSVQSTLHNLLNAKPEYRRDMKCVGKPSYSPPETLLKMAEVIICGRTNPGWYSKELDAGDVARTIQFRRDAFAAMVPKELQRIGGSRIQMLSSRPGDVPTGSVGATQADDVDHEAPETNPSETTALVRFWTDLTTKDTLEYEGAIERFFVHPHIAAIYARMVEYEHDLQAKELAIMCDACAQGFQPIGYVYVAWNELFGHLLKIGATMRTPHIRLRELSGAGMPEPFKLVSYIQTPNPFALEKTIHKHFANIRKYGRRKEFFTLTRAAAIAFFKSLGGFDAAERPPPAVPSKKRKAHSS